MFDWVHNSKRLIQVILALIFLPFVFFGVDSYFQGNELGREVARVGDYRVSQQEYEQALRERQDAMRRMMNNAPLDSAVLDSPEMRFAALEQLVRERLLLAQAVRSGMAVTDQQLKDLITAQDSFREGGTFSHDLYEAFLRSQKLTPLGFEARLRRDMLRQPLMDVFAESGFIPNAVVDRVVRLVEQTREASIASIEPSAFISRANVDDNAVKAYFESHAREFEVPEQVRLEYVVLSLDNLAAQVEIPAADVRQAYEQNPARFSSPEERAASHILIQVPAEASAEAKAEAKAKAEELTKQLQANPEQFADLARKHSQDPGSAQNGGDLGFLVRGATAKAFDDVLFRMKPLAISDPVETEFGYHIIRLNAVRGGAVKPFDDVRAAIEAEFKTSRAARRYAELAEELNNIAYEQSDSLQPAADALKVSVQQSPWITRTPTPGSPLGNERFLKAVFSEDVLRNKRNSEVVEVAPGTLIAARLLEHKPAASRSFEEVRATIRKRLIEDEASKLAIAEGREMLAKLRRGEDAGVIWSQPILVSRADVQKLDESVLREVFRVDPARLPAYAGIEEQRLGYRIVRVTQVNDPPGITPETRKAAGEQLKRMIGQEQMTDYVTALKQRVEVKIKPDLIEKK